MLKLLAADQLWVAEMPFHPPGLDLGARMTVVRLSDGRLFVHSPIRLTPELQQGLDALGPVGFVISPNRLHYGHLAEFARAYPQAKLYAPPGFRKTIPGVQFAGVLGDAPEPDWSADLDQMLFRGDTLMTEVDFFHRASRTLILTDVCFNIPSSRSLTTRWIARWLGVLDRLAPSRTFRLFLCDRQAARQSLERILSWDFDRVIIAHGEIVETGGGKQFRQAFAWLLD
jgi:uncharacterized protein DUF4336